METSSELHLLVIGTGADLIFARFGREGEYGGIPLMFKFNGI